MSTKPRVFIGSSMESVEYAYAIQKNLGIEVEATVWKQGIFEMSGYTLESLEDMLDEVDFGVFVFTPDDTTKLRQAIVKTVRDNVVFELGLFIGRLGRKRNFIIVPEDHENMHILTDLTGLTLGSFDSSRSDLRPALGPASHDVTLAVRKLGRLPGRQTSIPQETDPAIASEEAEGFSETDCLSLLKDWLPRKNGHGLITERFDEVDVFANLPYGTAKKYLDRAANEIGLETSERGNRTIRINYSSNLAQAPRVLVAGSAIKRPRF